MTEPLATIKVVTILLLVTQLHQSSCVDDLPLSAAVTTTPILDNVSPSATNGTQRNYTRSAYSNLLPIHHHHCYHRRHNSTITTTPLPLSYLDLGVRKVALSNETGREKVGNMLRTIYRIRLPMMAPQSKHNHDAPLSEWRSLQDRTVQRRNFTSSLACALPMMFPTCCMNAAFLTPRMPSRICFFGKCCPSNDSKIAKTTTNGLPDSARMLDPSDLLDTFFRPESSGGNQLSRLQKGTALQKAKQQMLKRLDTLPSELFFPNPVTRQPEFFFPPTSSRPATSIHPDSIFQTKTQKLPKTSTKKQIEVDYFEEDQEEKVTKPSGYKKIETATNLDPADSIFDTDAPDNEDSTVSIAPATYLFPLASDPIAELRSTTKTQETDDNDEDNFIDEEDIIKEPSNSVTKGSIALGATQSNTSFDQDEVLTENDAGNLDLLINKSNTKLVSSEEQTLPLLSGGQKSGQVNTVPNINSAKSKGNFSSTSNDLPAEFNNEMDALNEQQRVILAKLRASSDNPSDGQVKLTKAPLGLIETLPNIGATKNKLSGPPKDLSDSQVNLTKTPLGLIETLPNIGVTKDKLTGSPDDPSDSQVKLTKTPLGLIETLPNIGVTKDKLSGTPDDLSDRQVKLTKTPLGLIETLPNIDVTKDKLSETLAKLRDNYSNLSVTPTKLSNTTVKLSSTPAELSDTKTKLSGTLDKFLDAPTRLSENQAKLTDTPVKLSDTSDTPARLSETLVKLTDPPTRLSEAQAKLTDTPARLNEAQAKLTEAQVKLGDTSGKLLESPARLRETQAKSSDTNTKLGNTSDKLVETQAKLNETPARFSDAQAKLSDTPVKLSDTLGKLLQTSAKLSETQTKLSDPPAQSVDTSDKLFEAPAKLSETQLGDNMAKLRNAPARFSEQTTKLNDVMAKFDDTTVRFGEQTTKKNDIMAKLNDKPDRLRGAMANSVDPAVKLSSTSTKLSEPLGKPNAPEKQNELQVLQGSTTAKLNDTVLSNSAANKAPKMNNMQVRSGSSMEDDGGDVMSSSVQMSKPTAVKSQFPRSILLSAKGANQTKLGMTVTTEKTTKLSATVGGNVKNKVGSSSYNDVSSETVSEDGSTAYAGTKRLGYEAARQHCRDRNMTLAQLATTSDERLLRRLMTLNRPYWIGLSRDTGDRNFHWESGDFIGSLVQRFMSPEVIRRTGFGSPQHCTARLGSAVSGNHIKVECTELPLEAVAICMYRPGQKMAVPFKPKKMI